MGSVCTARGEAFTGRSWAGSAEHPCLWGPVGRFCWVCSCGERRNRALGCQHQPQGLGSPEQSSSSISSP